MIEVTVHYESEGVAYEVDCHVTLGENVVITPETDTPPSGAEVEIPDAWVDDNKGGLRSIGFHGLFRKVGDSGIDWIETKAVELAIEKDSASNDGDDEADSEDDD